MASKESEQSISLLVKNFSELGKNLRIFSLSIRSLYADKAVSASVENGAEFIRLRDETRNDAVAYLKGVMPLNETCVMKLQEFIEYYEFLSFEQWQENVGDILEEVAAYQEACFVLVKIHEEMMFALKQREEKAIRLTEKFGALQDKYEEEIKALREEADSEYGWALGLRLIPFLGAMASPILESSAKSDLAEAVAKRGHQETMLAAAHTIADSMSPALVKYIDGIKMVARFFNIMHKEMKQFDRMEGKKRLHYNALKKKAGEIKAGCRSFHGHMPSVRTDFQAIPTEGTDRNYVDEWLKKETRVIRENCKQKISFNIFQTALGLAEGISTMLLK